MQNKNELILKSLENTSNASSANCSLKIMCENNEKDNSIFNIPNRYFKNKIVLLPVTPNKSFVYWEITDEFLLSLNINPSDIHIDFVVLDDKNNVICRISSSFAVSEYYFEHTIANEIIKVALVQKVNGKEKYMLVSNTLFIADASIKLSSHYDYNTLVLLGQRNKQLHSKDSHYSSKDLV